MKNNGRDLLKIILILSTFVYVAYFIYGMLTNTFNPASISLIGAILGGFLALKYKKE